ncbi:Type 4 prepilin-like proteins leader peptide-processing enzyme [Andreprevotia sp. IGB-42]|uniref:prepilin peptidase n=1 Tax=Andreprevotia sp. IGB-42 TaxID=2497473 RepID=UPI00135ACF5D|nr:A24 family peptidase [Andreprevotia sp. IGB-42]KAF0811891.1 Type 4 prepilin-like proteins leader peptide-processing enzyme [Andreprevotia sp. IGB-42]
MDYSILFANPPVFGGFLLLLGLLVGSFLNVVIHRIPKMIEAEFRHDCSCIDLPIDAPAPAKPRYNLVVPRSACPHCGHQITALENIPVISYLVLRGRCRECGAHISLRYPAVELLTGLLTAVVGLHSGAGMLAVGAIAMTWLLIALIFIDADTYLLPDSLTLLLLWLGLLFNLYGGFVPLPQAVVGAAAGYLLLWGVFWAFKLTTGKEGMGYGDFKLLAALGAWFGWMALPVIVLLSSLAGAVIGIGLVVAAKRGFGKPMPFGPYLGIAGWLYLICGQQLQQALFQFH